MFRYCYDSCAIYDLHRLYSYNNLLIKFSSQSAIHIGEVLYELFPIVLLCFVYYGVRDLFHVYMNKCEFNFSRLHVYKINNFCFLLNNGHVPCMTK